MDAGGLSTAQMQAIATRIQLFPKPPSCCRRKTRRTTRKFAFFTVRSEIPFAGHPNVGTAFVLAMQAAKPPARLQFEEKAGLVPVGNPDGAGQCYRRRTDRAASRSRG